MFKFILLAAAILFVVTSMPQDNGRFKKRFAEPQLLPTQLRPIIAEPSDPWICIGRAKCNSRCAICCDTVERCRSYYHEQHLVGFKPPV